MAIIAYQNHEPRIHPTAWVHPSAEVIGEVHLGEEVSVWPTTVLRGDRGAIFIGAQTNLQDGVIAHATGGVSTTHIGQCCTVGHRAILHGCKVGEWCLIGMGAVLMDNVELGAWSFVAAGALLPPGKVYPPRSFVVGSPGKVLREVGERELEVIRRSCASYRELTLSYKRTGS